ncbi:MAG: uroporphyrinogen decarboxylase family protein, partial [Kiritimatiellaeota bacterium]|nr:uroporphyrinogen decarboxylase family protein [Kiritimatiellota bacterium]
QRILNTLARKPVDKPPFSLGFGVNPPARRALAAHLGISETQLDALLSDCVDTRWAGPKYTGPAHRNIRHADGSFTDIWGVTRRPMSYGDGSYDEICHYPLAEISNVAELSRHIFPSPDWFDYASFPALIDDAQRRGERAVILGCGNLFETAWYMRGFEAMLADLLAAPELADAILARVTDFFVAFASRALEAADGRVDIAFTADDIGGQEGLLVSLPLWEEMIKPHHARLNKALHSFNVKIMYHTDGAIMDALDGLVDMGIDILEALQFDARGMDPAEMKRRVGGKIAFYGGVSVQTTLPFGTPADVEREVRERLGVLGAGGGYILAPSHAIQAGTPPENILALLRAAGRL